MLRRPYLLLLFLLLIPILSIAQPINADPASTTKTPNNLSVTIFPADVSGHTWYLLETQVENPFNDGSVIDAASWLEFPLDTHVIGLQIGWRPGYGQPAGWSVKGRFSLAFDDPAELMTDRDFMSGLIIYTESPVELFFSQFSLDVGRELLVYNGIRLGPAAHFDYIQVHQDIIGYEGWSRFNENRIQVPLSGTDKALEYSISFVSPQFGVFADIEPASWISLSMTGSFGWVYIRDRDDHLLRTRVSTSSNIGWGTQGRGVLSVLPPFFEEGQLRIGVFAESRYYWAEGEMTQEWYGPDGQMSEGDSISGIPVKYEMLLNQFGIEVAAIF